MSDTWARKRRGRPWPVGLDVTHRRGGGAADDAGLAVGLDGAEVPAIKGRHLCHSEPFCDCYNAGVSSTQRPVGVQLDELRHAFVVSGSDLDWYQLSRREQRKNAASLLLPARLSSK
jgi:hypothetical protein